MDGNEAALLGGPPQQNFSFQTFHSKQFKPKDFWFFQGVWNGNIGQKWVNFSITPAGSNMFKVNNRNTGIRCEIGSKLKIKKPERRQ